MTDKDKKSNAPKPTSSIPGYMAGEGEQKPGAEGPPNSLPGSPNVGPTYEQSGSVAGPNGYYQFPNSYWDSPSKGKKRSTSGPEYGDYENVPMFDPAGLDPLESNRQDVHSDGAYRMLTPYQQELVRMASNSLGGYAVPASWYESTLDKALSISHYSGQGDGEIVTVEDALRDMIDPNVLAEIGSGGSGGGGGRAAPKPADATSIRRVMDATSTNLVGRTLSDAEFDKYYKQYVDQFNANPDLDTQQVLTERIREEDDYQEMQVAAKFSEAMSGIMKGAI